MHSVKFSGVLSAMGLALSLTGLSPAMAADNGLYIGASAGGTDWDVSATDFMTSGTVDDKDSGYKAFIGYNFNRNWGVELAYADLGKYDFSGTYAGSPVQGNADISAYSLALVGTVPLGNKFDLFGKLGAYSWDADVTASSGSTSGSVSGSESNALFGLGLKYNLTKQFSIRGEWERYNESNAIDMYSIGVAYKF